MNIEPGLLLWLWVFLAPMALMLYAIRHERRSARLRYRPPDPQPGDDWGGTAAQRPGWWEQPRS